MEWQIYSRLSSRAISIQLLKLFGCPEKKRRRKKNGGEGVWPSLCFSKACPYLPCWEGDWVWDCPSWYHQRRAQGSWIPQVTGIFFFFFFRNFLFWIRVCLILSKVFGKRTRKRRNFDFKVTQKAEFLDTAHFLVLKGRIINWEKMKRSFSKLNLQPFFGSPLMFQIQLYLSEDLLIVSIAFLWWIAAFWSASCHSRWRLYFIW